VSQPSNATTDKTAIRDFLCSHMEKPPQIAQTASAILTGSAAGGKATRGGKRCHVASPSRVVSDRRKVRAIRRVAG
jgi:hypothetical protein